jgi:hypothetical protein
MPLDLQINPFLLCPDHLQIQLQMSDWVCAFIGCGIKESGPIGIHLAKINRSIIDLLKDERVRTNYWAALIGLFTVALFHAFFRTLFCPFCHSLCFLPSFFFLSFFN